MRLPNAEHAGPDRTSYHDDETALYSIESSNPSLPIGNSTATEITNTTLLIPKEWIQFPPRFHSTVDSASFLPLQNHINIWLFVCLGGAGLALLASVLFLIFHCLQLRHRQRRQGNSQQTTRLMELDLSGEGDDCGNRGNEQCKELQEADAETFEVIGPSGQPIISYVTLSGPLVEVLDSAA